LLKLLEPRFPIGPHSLNRLLIRDVNGLREKSGSRSDTERVPLRRPFERQIDAVEQRLGIEFCGLLPLTDRFHDCG